MRLGIDLGTTRTVVAACDRGNFPVVGFVDPDGDVAEYLPTVSAVADGALVHGFAAERAIAGGAPGLRSWKRLLGRHGPAHPVRIGPLELALVDLAADYLRFVAESLHKASNLPGRSRGLPETWISVPANAGSTQRFTTFEAFRCAGFPVRAMLNEPSAAGLEYAHRHRGALNRARDHVAIYDLGGGTFDAALVRLAGGEHDVVESAGVSELGGDDFDAALLELALETAGVDPERAEPCRDALVQECRRAKESITPGTRRVVLELDALGEAAPPGPVLVPVADLEARLAPLLARSLEALGRVLQPREGEAAEDVREALARARLSGVYVVGGASALPLVARLLREVFGRRVHRSPYPSAAAAVGLAIAAEAGTLRPPVRERLTHELGVFREGSAGAEVVFDRLFPKGTAMPAPGEAPLVETRRYRAAHNVAHFRFVECDALGPEWQPRGDLAPHGEVFFPLAPELRGARLEELPVERLPREGRLIEERYEVDPSGVVALTIRDLEDGYSEHHRL
jgi:molecular chaperone DnaK (HSP70)